MDDNYWSQEYIEDLPWDDDAEQPEVSDQEAQRKLTLVEDWDFEEKRWQELVEESWDWEFQQGNLMYNDVYHPPPGIRFRLVHHKLDKCIYARDHRTPTTGCVPRAWESYPDQYFHLVYDTDRKLWALKNAQTGKYLEADPQGSVGHTSALGKTTQVFLDPAKDKKNKTLKGYFKVIFSNDDFEGALTMSEDRDTYYTVPANQAETEYHHWYMEYEDLEYYAIEWDDKNARIGSQQVVSLWTEAFDNGSSVTQQTEINCEEGVEQSSEFSHLYGASIGVSVEANVGLPFVGGGKVTASATGNTEFKWNKVAKWEKKYTIKTVMNWPPHTYMRGSIVVRKGTVDVPFVIKYRSVSTHQEICSWGVWKGVMSYDQSRRIANA